MCVRRYPYWYVLDYWTSAKIADQAQRQRRRKISWPYYLRSVGVVLYIYDEN